MAQINALHVPRLGQTVVFQSNGQWIKGLVKGFRGFDLVNNKEGFGSSLVQIEPLVDENQGGAPNSKREWIPLLSSRLRIQPPSHESINVAASDLPGSTHDPPGDENSALTEWKDEKDKAEKAAKQRLPGIQVFSHDVYSIIALHQYSNDLQAGCAAGDHSKRTHLNWARAQLQDQVNRAIRLGATMLSYAIRYKIDVQLLVSKANENGDAMEEMELRAKVMEADASVCDFRSKLALLERILEDWPMREGDQQDALPIVQPGEDASPSQISCNEGKDDKEVDSECEQDDEDVETGTDLTNHSSP